MKINCLDQYERLFPNDHEKAKAFDQIAEQYYFSNFGTMSKADIELLLFSIYLERLLDLDEMDIRSYSDYTLSKLLAISQSRVSSMKVRKELRYPRAGFDWKEAYQRCANQAVYAEGKIKVYLNDVNVYIEIKNAIEEAGGFVEKTLTSNLLQVAPEYYVDLMMKIRGETDRKAMIRILKEKLSANEDIGKILDQESIPALFKDSGIKYVAETVCGLVGIPWLSAPIEQAAQRLVDYLVEKGKNLFFREEHA